MYRVLPLEFISFCTSLVHACCGEGRGRRGTEHRFSQWHKFQSCWHSAGFYSLLYGRLVTKSSCPVWAIESRSHFLALPSLGRMNSNSLWVLANSSKDSRPLNIPKALVPYNPSTLTLNTFLHSQSPSEPTPTAQVSPS